MGNINQDDDFVHRLGKLVPVYILAWVTAVEGLLNSLTDDVFKITGLAIITLISFALLYLVEFKNQQVTNQTQQIVIVISTILFLFVLAIQTLFDFESDVAVQVNVLIFMVVLGWSFLVPYIVKEKTTA